MGLGEIRFQAECFLELPDGLIGLASLVQGGTEIGVGRGIVRLESQGCRELTDGLVGSPLLGQGGRAKRSRARPGADRACNPAAGALA